MGSKKMGSLLAVCLSLALILAGCSLKTNVSIQAGPTTTTPTASAQGKPFSVVPADTATPSPTSIPLPTPTIPKNGGQTSSENQIAQAVFQAINQSRATAGLAALRWNTALVNSAHQHNLAMVAAQELSHQLPGEPDLGTRETQQGVQWMWAGENIGYTSDLTQAGALGLHQAMMAEKPPDDGHRQNILTTNGTSIGVDIILDNQHQRLWLTEDFAKV